MKPGLATSIVAFASAVTLTMITGCGSGPTEQDKTREKNGDELKSQIEAIVCDDPDAGVKLHDALSALSVGYRVYYANGNCYGLDEPLTERELAHILSRLHGHTLTIENGWLRAGPSLEVPDADPSSDSTFYYRFEIGESTYRMTWERTRTYEVSVEVLWTGVGWRSKYEGTSMAAPELRIGRREVRLYLSQPYFQINEPEPPPRKGYYEVVVINDREVTSTLSLLPTMED